MNHYMAKNMVQYLHLLDPGDLPLMVHNHYTHSFFIAPCFFLSTHSPKPPSHQVSPRSKGWRFGIAIPAASASKPRCFKRLTWWLVTGDWGSPKPTKTYKHVDSFRGNADESSIVGIIFNGLVEWWSLDWVSNMINGLFMDCEWIGLRENLQENPTWENLWFPRKFPLNQSNQIADIIINKNGRNVEYETPLGWF